MKSLIAVTLGITGYALLWPNETRLENYFHLPRHSDHVFAFMLWSFFWFRCCHAKGINIDHILAGAFVAPILAELVQYLTPNHTPEIEGVFFSMIGAQMGMSLFCLWLLLYRFWKK